LENRNGAADQSSRATARRARGWELIPPPLLFVVPLLLGVLLERRFPLLDVEPPVARGLYWLGIALIVIGAGHAATSAALFLRNRTTIIPHHRSKALVTSGAYRWTRNPMYLGLTLVYLGVTALVAAVWPLVLLPLPLLIVNAYVIPMEERLLEEALGSTYLQYKARVRRWL